MAQVVLCPESQAAQVVLSPEDFLIELNFLGFANGNIYYRIPGVEGLHDGQVMVRLKKKRFVILDYSIQPNEHDMKAAQQNEHIKIPRQAGKAICIKPTCNKIGVPVCLYDSDPFEPDPLYLRSGLCFQCQRNLNEQRRTERKRPSKADREAHPSLIYAIGPSNKRFKIDGGTTVLKDDAIIINGAVEGTKRCGEGYGFQEIGSDLLALAHEAAQDTARLVNAVTGNTATVAAEAVAALGQPDYSTSATNILLEQGGNVEPPTSEDINALYYKAFQSMNKSIFLLSQWKSSWDSAISAAADSAADPSLADAVASAAAVVAAATSTPPAPASDIQDPSPNMVSLLLAANKSNGNDSEIAAAVAEHAEEQVDWQLQHGGQTRHERHDDAADEVCEYEV